VASNATVYVVTPQVKGQCLSDFLRAAQLPVSCEGKAAQAVVEKVLVNCQRQEWKICLTSGEDLCPLELDSLSRKLVELLPGVRPLHGEPR